MNPPMIVQLNSRTIRFIVSAVLLLVTFIQEEVQAAGAVSELVEVFKGNLEQLRTSGQLDRKTNSNLERSEVAVSRIWEAHKRWYGTDSGPNEDFWKPIVNYMTLEAAVRSGDQSTDEFIEYVAWMTSDLEVKAQYTDRPSREFSPSDFDFLDEDDQFAAVQFAPAVSGAPKIDVATVSGKTFRYNLGTNQTERMSELSARGILASKPSQVRYFGKDHRNLALLNRQGKLTLYKNNPEKGWELMDSEWSQSSRFEDFVVSPSKDSIAVVNTEFQIKIVSVDGTTEGWTLDHHTAGSHKQGGISLHWPIDNQIYFSTNQGWGRTNIRSNHQTWIRDPLGVRDIACQGPSSRGIYMLQGQRGTGQLAKYSSGDPTRETPIWTYPLNNSVALSCSDRSSPTITALSVFRKSLNQRQSVVYEIGAKHGNVVGKWTLESMFSRLDVNAYGDIIAASFKSFAFLSGRRRGERRNPFDEFPVEIITEGIVDGKKVPQDGFKVRIESSRLSEMEKVGGLTSPAKVKLHAGNYIFWACRDWDDPNERQYSQPESLDCPDNGVAKVKISVR